MTRSLQARVLAFTLALLGAVWLLAVAATALETRHELDELLDGHLAQAAALLVVQQAHPPDDDDTVDAPQLHRYARRVAFQVWHEGQLVMRSAQAPAQPLIEGPVGTQRGFATVQRDGQAWRVFATTGAERDVQVVVGEALSARHALLRALLVPALLPWALALPVLGLAVWWAVRRGLRPLQRLSGELAQRPPSALQPVATAALPRELEPLAAALNGLLARVAALLDGERRFTADAAHELRTPIAGIRAQAQVALNETDDAARRHALQATLRGCDRASRLVEQLLTLARLESQGPAAPSAQAAAADLGRVAQAVAADLAPVALARGQDLELAADSGCLVAADESLLAVLLRNLVDNAVRYSPPQARVQVAVHRDGGTVELVVEDSGPGLDAPSLQRLGQRFFRGEGHDAPGSGLGWSIVQRIARAQGAQVASDRSTALGGLRVRVRWPAAAQ